MSRRRFLRTGVAALAATAPWSWLAAGADARTPALKRLGSPEPFDYARLKGAARTLAASPYKAPSEQLPPVIERLDWDHWQAIRFRDEHSLWAAEGLRFQVRFFHLGFRIKKPVRMYVVDDGRAQELAYDTAMFDYSGAGLKGVSLPPNLGFAGFRLLFHTDWIRDVAAFQGASYAGDLKPYPLPPAASAQIKNLAANSDILILGEIHGTQEVPELVASLLTPLTEVDYHILALEVPNNVQGSLLAWARGKREPGAAENATANR